MTVLKRTCPTSQWDEGQAVIRDLELEAYHNNNNGLNFHSSKAENLKIGILGGHAVEVFSIMTGLI